MVDFNPEHISVSDLSFDLLCRVALTVRSEMLKQDVMQHERSIRRPLVNGLLQSLNLTEKEKNYVKAVELSVDTLLRLDKLCDVCESLDLNFGELFVNAIKVKEVVSNA